MIRGCTLIDGHVHLHRCHQIDLAIDAALDNLDLARSALGLSTRTPGVLWLVEGRDEGAAERLLAQRGRRWNVDASDDVCVRLTHREDGRMITVILGRQVQTKEDLEVLVIGTLKPFDTLQSLEATVEAGLEQEALVMLPWAFGKWTGSRGRAIAAAYQRYAPMGLRLADTAARNRFLPAPSSFALSVANRHPVLAGSDPFPFPDQLQAIGSHGFVLENVSPEAGWPELHCAIASLDEQPRRFGRILETGDFVRLQWKMQMRKRLRGGRAG